MTPCPFCGANGDRLTELWSAFDDGWLAHVHCTKCGAHGPSEYAESAGDAIRQAQQKWERRASVKDGDSARDLDAITKAQWLSMLDSICPECIGLGRGNVLDRSIAPDQKCEHCNGTGRFEQSEDEAQLRRKWARRFLNDYYRAKA